MNEKNEFLSRPENLEYLDMQLESILRQFESDPLKHQGKKQLEYALDYFNGSLLKYRLKNNIPI